MDNLCVICGCIIPEGRMACPLCEKRIEEQHVATKTRTIVDEKKRKGESYGTGSRDTGSGSRNCGN